MVATKENIRAAYIAPIKSVVCIDDDFPTFAEILREEKKCSATKEEVAGELTDPDSNPFLPKIETPPSIASSTSPRLNSPRNKDKERVFRLIESCHKEGYLIDIQNDYPNDEGNFISKADLLVLDYEFSGAPNKTLTALQRLAENPDYNLVIVYTQANVHEIALQTAACLYNIQSEMPCVSPNNEEKKLASDHLANWLENKEKLFDDIHIPAKSTKETLNAAFLFSLKEKCYGITPVDGHIEACNLTDFSSYPWIACHNLFLVFVGKDQGFLSIKELIEALCDALHAHGPTPMTLMMRHTISDFIKNIDIKINKLMPDRETKAAALFASLTNGADSNQISSCDCIIDHLLRSMFYSPERALSNDVRNIIRKYIQDIQTNEYTYQDIQDIEKASFSSKEDFFAVLNKFICCEPYINSNMTTGSIFKIEDDNATKYYICVSPECDLINKEIKQISSIEINLLTNKGKCLKGLTENKYIIFPDRGDILFGKIDQIKLSTNDFFCTSTALDNKKIFLNIIEASDAGIKFYTKEAIVVAQLRSEYAHRFMNILGSWRSRIGLGFINLPKDKNQ